LGTAFADIVIICAFAINLVNIRQLLVSSRQRQQLHWVHVPIGCALDCC
jgi:hypothetical protein